MALNSIYRKYFQKSKVFVYPLLGIARGSAVVPIQTYFEWNNVVKSEDNKLVCLYPNREDASFKSFNEKVLLNNNRLVDMHIIDEENLAYIFDFNDLRANWTNIVEGKYSKIDMNLKHKILKFFKDNHGTYLYVESYLFPEKYFEDYANILNVDINLLKSVGELCSKPDYEKECLTLLHPDLEFLGTNNIINSKN